MELIEWDQKYSVGKGEMDGEHKKLFALINDLNNAVYEKSAPEKNREIIHALLEYTEYHFSHEETILKKYKYSQLDQHVTVHNLLIGKVKDLRDEQDRGKEITGTMLNLLQDWICQHILILDQHYAVELEPHFLAE